MFVSNPGGHFSFQKREVGLACVALWRCHASYCGGGVLLHARAQEWCLPELRGDRAFMLRACALDGDCLFYASGALQVQEWLLVLVVDGTRYFLLFILLSFALSCL